MVLQGTLGDEGPARTLGVSGVSLESAAGEDVWERGRSLILECLPLSRLQQTQVSLSEIWGSHVAQAGLQFLVSQVLDYRHALSHPIYVTAGVGLGASCKLGDQSTFYKQFSPHTREKSPGSVAESTVDL